VSRWRPIAWWYAQTRADQFHYIMAVVSITGLSILGWLAWNY
jgi:hypothetical protein